MPTKSTSRVNTTEDVKVSSMSMGIGTVLSLSIGLVSITGAGVWRVFEADQQIEDTAEQVEETSEQVKQTSEDVEDLTEAVEENSEQIEDNSEQIEALIQAVKDLIEEVEGAQ